MTIYSLYEDIQDEATLEEILPPDTTVGSYRQIESKLKHQRVLKEQYDVRGMNLEGKLRQHGAGHFPGRFIDHHANAVQRTRSKGSSVITPLSRANSSPFGSLLKDSISNSKPCRISKP